MRSPPTFHLNRTALGASSATVAQLGVQKPRAANVAQLHGTWDTPYTYTHVCKSRQHGTPRRPLTSGRQPTYTVSAGGTVQR